MIIHIEKGNKWDTEIKNPFRNGKGLKKDILG